MVITSQKNEMSNKLGKLHESIASQKQEITATVERKIEASNEKLEQVLKENISLKKSNSVLQECLSRIESTQLDNNVILIIGLKEKFNQNPLLKSMLVATKPKLLVEASTDRL